MPILSVLIPARNEQWLARTVADVLAHARADTEVIVVLDGAWPDEPLPQHPALQVVYLPTAIGQRAATNLAARVSNARYVMKLDAHCSVAEGFDVALITAAVELGPHVTQVPAQHNLHVFDWVCSGCGARTYQGPTPTAACACGAPATAFHRDVIWKPRRGVRTTAWRFDAELKFQYWGEFTKREEGKGEITETLSCLGACWFLDREWYWSLGGLDEAHGSWGQMGTEIACKSWLSGGRLVTNQRTWFAHLFRTQGGDFGFPYPLSGREVEHARAHSKSLWLGEQWPGAIRPLSWLIDHFAPVPEWAPKPLQPSRTKGIVYYSDCRPDAAILAAAQHSIEASGLPIVAVTLAPVQWPAARNLVLPLERGTLTMFRQILAGLEALDTDDVFFCEHDVLYHQSHFAFAPPSAHQYFYNMNVWKVDAQTGRAVHYRTKQTSGLCADRQLLIAHYRTRIARVEREGFSRKMGFEPGSHSRSERVDDVPSGEWRSPAPNIDIRHTANLTASRWARDQFRDQRNCQGWTEADEIPGWGRTKGRFAEWLAAVSRERVPA